MDSRYTSPTIPIPSAANLDAFDEWLINVRGIDQGGPSFEARIFVNNMEADEGTPLDEEHGYAGSFHVYGYGLDPEQTDPLPMDRGIGAKQVLNRVLSKGQQGIKVTVVPVFSNPYPGQSRVLRPSLGIRGVDITPG